MRLKTSETGQKREGFDAAERSDEVKRTPAKDCGLAEGFHLGSACRGLPWRRQTRRPCLGAENGPLTRPAASSGASAGNGAAAVGAAAAALASGEGEGAGGTEWRLGARGAVPTGVSRSAERRVHNAGWSEAGVRTWERGGEAGPRGLDGPKGRRVGPVAPAPFFLNFFSPIVF